MVRVGRASSGLATASTAEGALRQRVRFVDHDRIAPTTLGQAERRVGALQERAGRLGDPGAGHAANLNVHFHGLLLDGVYRCGTDGEEARTLRPLQAAAITYRSAFGSRARQKVLALRGAKPRESPSRQALCAEIDGFSVHAAARVRGP